VPLFYALPRTRTLLQRPCFTFDKSARTEIPAMVMSPSLALRRSKVNKAW
jgi:hypothetical protein